MSIDASIVPLFVIQSIVGDVPVGREKAVDQVVAAGGCANIARLLQDATQPSPKSPLSIIAVHFAVDCVVRMCIHRPEVPGLFLEANALPALVKLLELLMTPNSVYCAYRGITAVDAAFENHAAVAIVLSCVGHLALNNPKAAFALSEAGVIPLVTVLLKAGRASTDPRWLGVHQQAEFALKACIPPAPSSVKSRQSLSLTRASGSVF